MRLDDLLRLVHSFHSAFEGPPVHTLRLQDVVADSPSPPIFSSSSLSDLNGKLLISLQFAFSSLRENGNDISLLAVRGVPSPTGC